MNFLRMYDYKWFKASNTSILKRSDIKIFDYKHEIIEPSADAPNGRNEAKNSVDDLKHRILNEFKTSESNLIKYCEIRLKQKPIVKEDHKEEKQDQEPQNEKPAEGKGVQLKPKPELVPAGYQEEV